MKQKLATLAIGMFAMGCNTFLIAGLLPQISQTIHQPIAVTGQGISIYSLTYLIAAPLFSILFANKPAKGIMQLSLILFFVGNLITFASQNLAMFLIGRSVAGIGAGIFTPLCISIAVSLVDAVTKGRVLSFVWGANCAGVVFGVPLALYLTSLINWQASIAFVNVLGAVALIGFALEKTDEKTPPASSVSDRLKLMTDPKTLSVFGISSFTSMATLGLYSYITLLQSGSSNSLSSTLFSWGLGGFFGSSLVGILTDRSKSPRLTMVFILLGLILTIAAIPFTKSLQIFGLIPFFFWGAFGWALPTPQQQILFELHENQSTILAATNSSALGLGATLGTAFGGLLISSGIDGMILPFISVALLSLVLIAQIVMNSNFKKVCRT